jgi:hypothetical protein
MTTFQSEETSLRVLTSAVKEAPISTRAAWGRVRRALYAPATPRRPLTLRPLAASMSVLLAFFFLSQVGLINRLTYPTVTANFIPAPHAVISTPVAAQPAARPGATATPRADVIAPIPLPPNNS